MIEKNFKHINVSELLLKVRNGDHSAFEVIINDYKRLVIHVVYRMVSDPDDREDLFQDIFLKVYNNIKNFRFQSKFSTWIAKIAYNTCLNYIKKNKPETIDEKTLYAQYRNPFSNPESLPDNLTAQKDITAQVHKEIKNLNYKYRTILTLFHLEEMSYKEIGKIMNIPQGSVKSYLFRARKELKKQLIVKFKDRELCKITT